MSTIAESFADINVYNIAFTKFVQGKNIQVDNINSRPSADLTSQKLYRWPLKRQTEVESVERSS